MTTIIRPSDAYDIKDQAQYRLSVERDLNATHRTGQDLELGFGEVAYNLIFTSAAGFRLAMGLNAENQLVLSSVDDGGNVNEFILYQNIVGRPTNLGDLDQVAQQQIINLGVEIENGAAQISQLAFAGTGRDLAIAALETNLDAEVASRVIITDGLIVDINNRATNQRVDIVEATAFGARSAIEANLAAETAARLAFEGGIQTQVNAAATNQRLDTVETSLEGAISASGQSLTAAFQAADLGLAQDISDRVTVATYNSGVATLAAADTATTIIAQSAVSRLGAASFDGLSDPGNWARDFRFSPQDALPLTTGQASAFVAGQLIFSQELSIWERVAFRYDSEAWSLVELDGNIDVLPDTGSADMRVICAVLDENYNILGFRNLQILNLTNAGSFSIRNARDPDFWAGVKASFPAFEFVRFGVSLLRASTTGSARVTRWLREYGQVTPQSHVTQATFESEVQTLVTDLGAEAQAREALAIEVAGNSAEVATVAALTGTISGQLSAFYGIRVGVDGEASIVLSDGTGLPAVIQLTADEIRLNGNVLINNTVTRREAFNNNGSVNFSNVYTTVASVTITTTGGTVALTAQTNVTAGTGPNGGTVRVQARLRRGSIVVRELTVGSAEGQREQSEGIAFQLPGVYDGSATLIDDDTPGAGTHTYSVQLRTTTTGHTGTATNRTLSAREHKTE